MGHAHKKVVVSKSGFEARIKGSTTVFMVGCLDEPLTLERMVDDATEWLDTHHTADARGPLDTSVKWIFAGLNLHQHHKLTSKMVFDKVE